MGLIFPSKALPCGLLDIELLQSPVHLAPARRTQDSRARGVGWCTRKGRNDLLWISIIIQIQIFRLYDGHPLKVNCHYNMFQPAPASDTSSFRW